MGEMGNSKSDVVAMMTVGGGFLGLLVLGAPAFGRCGADAECIFGIGGVAIRGGMIGLIVGLILGVLMAIVMKPKKEDRNRD